MLDNLSGELTVASGFSTVPSGKAAATLDVTDGGGITLTKDFTDDPIPPGATATLEFEINNFDRNFSATGVAFSDALAVALVVGSGLMLKSVATLLAVDTGFDAARLMSFEIFLPPGGYADGVSQQAFHQRLAEGLKTTTGVESIGIASGLPPLRDLNANDTEFEGLQRDPEGPPHNIDYYQFIDDDYLRTMEIELVAGRGFRLSDDAQSSLVALINQKTADTFWPGQNPLGRRLRPGPNVPWITIVGIVGDVKQGGIDQETTGH